MKCTRALLASCIGLFVGLAQAQNAEDARRFLDQGQYRTAVQAYTGLIEQHPTDPDHWLGRGLAQVRQGAWRDAVNDLERAVAIAPSYADAWSALADVYRWNDQAAAAANAYARLAVLRPNDVQVRVLQARSLLAAQDVPGARAAVQRARELGAAEDTLPALPGLAAVQAAPAQAETPPVPETLNQDATADGHKWAVSVGVGRSASGSSVARDNSLSLRRYGELGSIAVERLGLSRFGDTDQAWAVDAYPRLWRGAYANVRYQFANTPDLYPARSWRAELYQNVGGGWELAASRDFLGFGSGVRIDGVAAGKYWGNFFARWRHQQVSSDSSAGKGDRFFVRYYYEGDANHYVELNASKGRSDDFGSALIQQSRSDSRGVVWYHFVTRDWGFKLSASESNDSSAYNSKARDLGLGLTRRW